MGLIVCPACAAQISDTAGDCPQCGVAITSTGSNKPRLIGGVGGKLQAIGVLLLASGVIATVLGTWWGPAVLLPGIVFLMMGKAA